MNEEQIRELLEEIAPDEDGIGYIDCSSSSSYSDDNQYERIIAAVKQNVKLHNKNDELTKELEDVKKQEAELLAVVENLKTAQEEAATIVNNLIYGITAHLTDIYDMKKIDIRIGDYVFKGGKDTVNYKYDPIKKVEPVEVNIKIVTAEEHANIHDLCPICKKELGEHPVISRKDNKTKICSSCGVLEALEIFNTHVKEGNNE